MVATSGVLMDRDVTGMAEIRMYVVPAGKLSGAFVAMEESGLVTNNTPTGGVH